MFVALRTAFATLVVRSTVTTVASGVAVRRGGGAALVMGGAEKRRARGAVKPQSSLTRSVSDVNGLREEESC